MQSSGVATRPQNAVPFSNAWGNSGDNTLKDTGRRSRPGTSHGEESSKSERPNVLTKDRERKNSFSRRSSFSSPSKGKRRASSSNIAGGQYVTDSSVPPLPDFAIATAAKIARESETVVPSPASGDSFSKMLSRTAPTPANGYNAALTTPPISQANLQPGFPSESNVIYQHLQEIANKRISTLDYLRKAHEGRVFWFNTLLFDKPDLARMPYFDSRKLARRATNYLLLGLSLPTVIDLNSSSPQEFLRSLNTLFTEFDSFQQIHTENGINASSLSRARLPQMFRRGTGSSKGRRASGAGGDVAGFGDGGANGSMNSNGGANQSPTSVISFGLGGEGNDLLPGEEYTHLLTPSLPFDPDFFETFATLCDVLIDCYTRFLSLIPSPRDCTPPVADLFSKADTKVRKLMIQGVVKEFEDFSRAGLKQEVANVGKVVLGGLM